MRYEPSLFGLEDRGYNRGTGHALLPSGQAIAVSQEDDELASALIAEWWEVWRAELQLG